MASNSSSVQAQCRAALAANKVPASVPATKSTGHIAAYVPSMPLNPNQLCAAVCGLVAGINAGHAVAQPVRGVLRAYGHRAGGHWQALTWAQWQQAFGLAVHVMPGSTSTPKQQQAAVAKQTRTLTAARGKGAPVHTPVLPPMAALRTQQAKAQQAGTGQAKQQAGNVQAATPATPATPAQQ